MDAAALAAEFGTTFPRLAVAITCAALVLFTCGFLTGRHA